MSTTDDARSVLIGVAILGGGILIMQALAAKMGADLGKELGKEAGEFIDDTKKEATKIAVEWERRNVAFFSPTEYVVNNSPAYVPGAAIWTAKKPDHWSVIRPPGYTVEKRDSPFQRSIKENLEKTPERMMQLPPWNILKQAAGLLDQIMPKATAAKTDNSALIYEPGTGYPAVGNDKKYLSLLDLFKPKKNYEGYVMNSELDHDIEKNPSNYERVGPSDALNKTTGQIETISQATKGETNQIPGFNAPMDGGLELPVQDPSPTVYNSDVVKPGSQQNVDYWATHKLVNVNGNMVVVEK